MPDFGTTAKHGLRKLLGTSLVRDVDAGIAALADDLDPIIATDDQGTLAGRPVSSPGSPGIKGRYYFVDSGPSAGTLWRDNGTGWDPISGPVGAFSAYRNAALTALANAAIVFDVEEGDVSNWYDTATGRFTPQVAGWYRLSAGIKLPSVPNDTGVGLVIRKNGVFYKNGGYAFQRGGTIELPASVSASVIANGSTDYFTITPAFPGAASQVVSTGLQNTYFQGELIGRS